MIRLYATPKIILDGRRDMPFSRSKYYVLLTPMIICTQSLGKITTLKIAGKCHSREKKNSTDDPDAGINRQDL